MQFWERINPRRKEICNDMRKRIKKEFSVEVTEDSPLDLSQLTYLYKALGTVFDYYDINAADKALYGLKIAVVNRLTNESGNTVKGRYDQTNNVILLLASDPGSLVHELIHAIDFNFRNKDKNGRKSFIMRSPKAFIRFLKASDVPRNDVADFIKTFQEMRNVDDEYLSRPSEILARGGSYSFWRDNENACADNPFLRFSPEAYKINESSIFGRSICQFPFHKIEAVRQFVHHAAREEAGLEFAPWHPEVHERPVMNHESGWYEKSRNYVLDIANRYNTAIENLSNAEYCIENIKYYHTDEDIMNMRNALEKARADLAPVEKEYQQCISFFLNEIGDKEFHERFDEIRSDCKLVLLSAYLGDCRNVASLCEEKAKEKTAKRKNIPIKNTE